MVQTTVYPLKDRAAAFCRGFKTFHPFVEVAKEGLTRKGLNPEFKRIYEERVSSVNPSREQLLKQMNERLFNAKVFFGVSLSMNIIASTIPLDQEGGQMVRSYLYLMGGIAAAIWLGFMRKVSDSFKQTKPNYFLKSIYLGLGGFIFTPLSVGVIDSLFDGVKSLSSDGINPLMIVTSSTLVIASGFAVISAVISVKCISSFFRTKLPESNEKSEVRA